jgi:hypothetical protein
MRMDNAINVQHPPMYLEARAYCDEYGHGPEEFERVRTMLAVAELRRRIEPWQRQAVRLLSLEKPKWVTSGDGAMRSSHSLETDRALAKVQEQMEVEAKALGLNTSEIWHAEP